MLGSSKPEPQHGGRRDEITPLDIIFSCNVCNATFTDVYRDGEQPTHMPSDGINPKDRTVTRLFLAACCHVFCSKHLEGGGAPFHPAGSRPRAACAVCSKDSELYAVRGFGPGDYDTAIPACWFTTPPTKLDGQGSEMEALRFQYIALIAYSTQITLEHRQAIRELEEAQGQICKLQRMASEEHAKVLTLQHENERLCEDRKELARRKEQLPVVQHYLSYVPILVEQNKLMKERLASLGFQMHFQPLPSFDKYDHLFQDADEGSGFPGPVDASTFSGDLSADTLVNFDGPRSVSLNMRPHKRQRVESPPPNIHMGSQQHEHRLDKNLMPPPEKPLSRLRPMKSFRKIIPALRKKVSNYRAPSAMGYQGEMSDLSQADTDYGLASRRGRHGNEDTYRMSGALPPGEGLRTPQLQLQHSSIGLEPQVLTPQAADQIYQHPAARPNEPSYARLLDCLSSDTALDLGLVDPRQQAMNHLGMNKRREEQNRNYHQPTATPKRFSLGHAFLHQSPNNQSLLDNRHPDPLRSNPIHSSRTVGRESVVNATPRPPQSRQLHETEESVVSPFFRNRKRPSRRYSPARVNERTGSSLPISNVSRFSRQRTAAEQRDWHEARGLNGLSFFATPVNKRNEPIATRTGMARTGMVEQVPYRRSVQRYSHLGI